MNDLDKISQFNPKLANPETVDKLISTTDDMLKTLITMSSALLAVGVVFDDFVKIPLMRLFIILMLFLGLILAFLGILPFRVRYDIEDAEELKEQHIRSFRRKRRHLWYSAASLALGLTLVIIDLMIEVFGSASMHP